MEEIGVVQDDTNILLKSVEVNLLTDLMERCMQNIKEWIAGNGLILNEDKTNVIYFKTSRSRQQTPTTVTIDNKEIKTAKQVKFLGLMLDEHLNWESHIDMITGKLNSTWYSMRIIKKYVDIKTIKNVYHAGFESVLRYGVIFWGQSTDVERVFRIQKGVLRTILGLNRICSCRGHFRSNNIMTLCGLYIYELLIFMFKNSDLFEDLKTKSLRNENYIYPRHRLTIYEKGCFYTCITVFNALPAELQQVKYFRSFKSKIHDFLIRLEPYTIQEYLERRR
ncbi:uncharacterized protein LOC123318934 [Coccinella septempunctata]|uniref:uncharacterized protein LOC123318934 n=1 Tax=Coccinella septempunctata TaxID=41139 RepID=UPI001D091B40|nr:uncharacterized protein LOC123318934 [Coccinella septempunctata]